MNDKIRYFLPKLKNRISAEKTRIYEKLPVEKISLRGIDACGGKEGMVRRLHKLLGCHVIDVVRNGNELNTIIGAAEKTCSHIFDLLGAGDVNLNPINWNKEIKTGYEWPLGVYYTKLRALTPKGSDIKMPWELSRCHHLLWLGEAYIITDNKKYAKEIVDEINNWLDNNPLMYTVNWTCAMDVAIRSINWMYALLFIEKSKYFDDTFAEKVYRSLYQHLFFISNNLERCIPYSNNHYVSNIVGLLYLGAFFSANSRGRKALKFAQKEYLKEILVEVLPSGINYEKSVSYHRLMTELLVYSRCMLVRIGENIPKEVEERLMKMLEYIGYYSVSDGSPLVGDNDDGRLLPFVPRDFKNHTYLINNDSLEWNIINSDIKPITTQTNFSQSQVFTDANVAVLKRNKGYVFVSCSPRWKFDKATNKFVGTHLHNDLLSFVYCDDGKEIIVDPGAFCYTSDMERRNEFRSARKHNTIIVDGEEQNFLEKKSAFGMKYNSCAEPLILFEYVDCVSCKGEYKTFEGNLLHQRTYNLYDKCLEINDMLTKHGKGHSVYISFHFANGVKVCLEDKYLNLEVCGMRYQMYIVSQKPLAFSLKDDTISPSFGVLKKSKTLIVEFTFDEEAECVTMIKKI